MGTALLNLISTPIPVLNSLGLDLRVGLSSEDPTVINHPSEAYDAYLSIFSPEGLLLTREHLGEIPPHRRRFFAISPITRKLVPQLDHLIVVHRVPSRLLSEAGGIEDEVELDEGGHYNLFRSLVEYSFPGGANGSVIYETPAGLNGRNEGRTSSNTLTFTSQVVLSSTTNTYMVLVHSSVDASYSAIAKYEFGVFSLSGECVASDRVQTGPFSINVLDMAQVIPDGVIEREKDPQDGQSSFTYIGYSDNAAILTLVINAAPVLGAVSVEHTHPPQTYLMPWRSTYHRELKTEAQRVWKSLFSARRVKQK